MAAAFGAVPEDYWSDPRIEHLDHGARFFGAAILGVVCARGRFGTERDLALALRVFDVAALRPLLAELEAAGWLRWYDAPSAFGVVQRFGEVVRFNEYRGLPDNRRAPSKLAELSHRWPEPVEERAEVGPAAEAPRDDCAPTSDSLRDDFGTTSEPLRARFDQPAEGLRDHFDPAAEIPQIRDQRSEIRSSKSIARAGAREEWPPGTEDTARRYARAQSETLLGCGRTGPFLELDTLRGLAAEHPKDFTPVVLALIRDSAKKPEIMTRSPVKWIRARLQRAADARAEHAADVEALPRHVTEEEQLAYDAQARAEGWTPF